MSGGGVRREFRQLEKYVNVTSNMAIRSSLVLAAAWFLAAAESTWVTAQTVSIDEDKVVLKQGASHTLSVTYQSPGGWYRASAVVQFHMEKGR